MLLFIASSHLAGKVQTYLLVAWTELQTFLFSPQLLGNYPVYVKHTLKADLFLSSLYDSIYVQLKK